MRSLIPIREKVEFHEYLEETVWNRSTFRGDQFLTYRGYYQSLQGALDLTRTRYSKSRGKIRSCDFDPVDELGFDPDGARILLFNSQFFCFTFFPFHY